MFSSNQTDMGVWRAQESDMKKIESKRRSHACVSSSISSTGGLVNIQ